MALVAKQPTQGERILRVLADKAWHSTSELHRRAGNMIIHSRISELRKRGEVIEHRHLKGQKGARAHQYRWHNPPPEKTLSVIKPTDDDVPEFPRDLDHRYRIYCVPRYGEQTLVGAVATPEAVGVFLVEKGRAGDLKGCTVGILDTHGVPKETKPGDWLANPHEGRW